MLIAASVREGLCLAVGSDDRASLCVVAQALEGPSAAEYAAFRAMQQWPSGEGTGHTPTPLKSSTAA